MFSMKEAHASSEDREFSYSIHQFKILILEDAPGTCRWQPASEAPCKIWNRSRIDWMQFEQVIVLLLNQGIDISKASKSFKDWADLFVIVSKLIGISRSALAVEEGLGLLKSLRTYLQGSKMT